jgi:hypothetical protein
VGRKPGSPLELGNPEASALHACLSWTGDGWEVRDLGSRNGTYVGAHRLEKGGTMAIGVCTTLAFGNTGDLYELVNDEPPAVFAEVVGGDERCTAETGLLTLPGHDDPELTVFEDAQGEWKADIDGQQRSVRSGDIVQAGGRSWRLHLPTVSVAATLVPPSDHGQLIHIGSAALRFRVSRDEEHVDIDIQHPGGVMTLKHRVYHYLLLILARARIADQRDGESSPSEQGWLHVSQLLDMLRTSEPHLNVDVCRARRGFARAKVQGAVALFERRTGQIRIGVEHLEEVPL